MYKETATDFSKFMEKKELQKIILGALIKMFYLVFTDRGAIERNTPTGMCLQAFRECFQGITLKNFQMLVIFQNWKTWSSY